MDTFNNRRELPGYSRMVPALEIASQANDYNLNIPRYIDASEPEDLHDLDAHLNGGVPDRDIDALADYWQVFPSLRDTLFERNGRPGYSDILVPISGVRDAILDHAEFSDYRKRVVALYESWREAHSPALLGLDADTNPKVIIRTLSEDLLARFADMPLIDPYDLYQRLIDYWEGAMQDDVYLIAARGWSALSRTPPRGR